MGKILIGTSGFAYEDWVGPFYPPALNKAHRLEYYARRFPTVEINSTFYQLPALPSVYGMLNKVDTGFTFFVKAHKDLTHVLRNAEETLPRFKVMLDAYQNVQKLAGVLLQFPEIFEPTEKNEEYVRRLVDSLQPFRSVVEFRHSQWLSDKTMRFLMEHDVGYCIVDMPEVRNLPGSRIETTSDIAYIRFHGQNRDQWVKASTRDARYDYDYSEEELCRWVPVLINLSKDVKEVYVYFNNHYRGKAAKNADSLRSFVESYVVGSNIPRER
jgi:uncharacterized protein YecE (DUF72 family)